MAAKRKSRASEPVEVEPQQEEDLDLEDKSVEKLLEYFPIGSLQCVIYEAVKKNLDLAENVRHLADVDPAQRKIFVHVHGLGWDATPETLTSVFGKYGEIEDCKHYTDKHTRKLKSFAFILFKHRSSARKALKHPLKIIGNRATMCQLAIASGPFTCHLYFYENAEDALEEYYKNIEGHTLYCQEAVDGGGGHLMAPTGPSVGGYNPRVPQQGLNPALANQGAGLQIGSFLRGLGGAPLSQIGPIPVVYGSQATQMGHGTHCWTPLGMQHGYQNPQIGQDGHYWNPPVMQHGYQNPQMGQGGHHWIPPEMQQGYQNPHMGQGGHYWNPPGMQQGNQNPQMGQGGHDWYPLGMQHGYQNPHMGRGGHYCNPPGIPESSNGTGRWC